MEVKEKSYRSIQGFTWLYRMRGIGRLAEVGGGLLPTYLNVLKHVWGTRERKFCGACVMALWPLAWATLAPATCSSVPSHTSARDPGRNYLPEAWNFQESAKSVYTQHLLIYSASQISWAFSTCPIPGLMLRAQSRKDSIHALGSPHPSGKRAKHTGNCNIRRQMGALESEWLIAWLSRGDILEEVTLVEAWSVTISPANNRGEDFQKNKDSISRDTDVCETRTCAGSGKRQRGWVWERLVVWLACASPELILQWEFIKELGARQCRPSLAEMWGSGQGQREAANQGEGHQHPSLPTLSPYWEVEMHPGWCLVSEVELLGVKSWPCHLL